jgi:predicted kinase
MCIVELADVAGRILRSTEANGTPLVAVDGCAGAGKTTLARRLAALLDAPIATTDDFLSWTDLDGWWSRFERDILEPLLARRDARYAVRDWQRDPEGYGVTGTKTTPCAPVVLIEGVTSSRRAVTDRLAFRVWVDAPEQVRRERNLSRADYWHDHWDAWLVRERAFFAADGTRDRADLLVDGASTIAHDPDTQVVVIDRQARRPDAGPR